MNDDQSGAMLSNQLVAFVCVYLAQHGVDPTASQRHPEQYVRLGVKDAVAAGIGTLDLSGEVLFLAFAAAVATRIDRDMETPLSREAEKSFRRHGKKFRAARHQLPTGAVRTVRSEES